MAHLEVYRCCPEVAALVHAHPPAVLALSALGRVPAPELLLEGKMIVPRVEAVAVLPPGSRQLADACARAVRAASAVVLAEHGALTAGRDLWEALERIEVLELLARIDLARSGVIVPI